MAEKQKVKAVVVATGDYYSQIRYVQRGETTELFWPYPIPAGTQVTITVEFK